MLARLGRHWGWLLAYGVLTLLGLATVLGIWLAIFGVMEITAAFRGLGRSASPHQPPPPAPNRLTTPICLQFRVP
jgi:uncharacterized membrane protein HdeD (DUF308 family)